jgi:CheY-like chemotaxis protein
MTSILLNDDDEQLRTMLSVVLKRAGYEVQVAIDGIEASNFYRGHPADLILTDLIMPGKEGLEIIRELHKDYPQAKIIAMSGGGRTGTMSYLNVAKAFGAQEVLEKPFPNQEILEAIRRVLAA